MRYDPYKLDDVDPEIGRFLAELAQSPGPGIADSSIEAARELIRGFCALSDAPPMKMNKIEDASFTYGETEIPVRIYEPEGFQSGGGALVYFHGGGWTIGDLDTHNGLCTRLAHFANIKVISVDYRLAPEHKFPAATNDCMAAFMWVLQSAASLQINPKKIAVGGDSAGGNLAAIVAAERADTTNAPAHQYLIYPATQLCGSTYSHEALAEGLFLTRAEMLFFLDMYFTNPVDALSPLASPLLREYQSKLCPATIITAGLDPLSDEGAAYALQLKRNGVKTDHQHYPAMIHGFFQCTGVSQTAASIVKQSATELGCILNS